MIQITKTLDVQLSPDDLAKAFWDLDGDQQAIFFNALSRYPKFMFQMQYVADSKSLRDEGRRVMETIGNYAFVEAPAGQDK